MSRILIVEDEAKIARFIELELTHEGYETDKVDNGRAAVEAALAAPYDLILLDVLLPQLNGMEVLRRIRLKSDVPVIMLTARDAVMDKVAGLDAGADDYITKPFAIEELLARIRVALKRREMLQARAASSAGEQAPAGPESPARQQEAGTRAADGGAAGAQAPAFDRTILTVGRVTMDVDRHEVTVDGEPVPLTHREFELLRTLMENRNRVLSREQLAREALGYDYVGETNVVDVHIRHLRSKIDDRYGFKLITTVRGVGYVIREG